MRSRALRFPLVLALLALALAPGASLAAEPPSQHDPCSRNARDTCGTTGVGQYKTYRFGPRWFGDYRGAVPGVSGPTFCIDLRFWYPSKGYGYERRSVTNLRNRDGDAVSVGALRRMAYALWAEGRTQNATRQGAVMLYVHRLMGDAAPGEVDPAAVSAAVKSTYERIARDAARYAGPYKLDVKAPATLTTGKATTVTVRVLSASGAALPGVDVRLAGSGAGTLPGSVNTGADGSVAVPVTPDDAAGGLKLTATTQDIAAELPRMYAPTKGAAARSGQRLVAPDSQRLTAKIAATVLAQPVVRTQVSAATLEPGESLSDTVIVEGLGTRRATVTAALYGPFPSADKLVCTTPPVWAGSIEVTGDGTSTTEAVPLPQPGFYTYRESIAATDDIAPAETACAEASETTVVRGHPDIRTQVSAAETAPGAKLTDTAVVTGLGVLSAPVQVQLWGPFDSSDAIRCEGTPVATSTFTANGDGSYVTEPVTLPRAGYYSYREALLETPAYAGVQNACGEATETTFAKAAPVVKTVVSAAVVGPGGSLTDRIDVTGSGTTPLSVEVELFGPFHSRGAIRCTGTPLSRSTVQASGDGRVTSKATRVAKAGFYTYRERIKGSALITAAETECGEAAETSLAAPLILTGRGDGRAAAGVSASTAAAAAGVQPTRVRLARLGIDAPIAAVDIDVDSGVLDIPKNIQKVGWWQDGAPLASPTGAILLAGHVDSAKDGGGAFYALKSARKGDTIRVTGEDGKVRSYRVRSIVTVRKSALPASIFSQAGKRRLVLVTCGGPFLPDVGHYRDNVVVTAWPV